MDKPLLDATALALLQFHPGGWHTELPGQKLAQMLIGPAFDRRRGDPDFQRITVGAGDFVTTGTGLQVDPQ